MKKGRLLSKYIVADILSALIVWVAFVVFRKYINDISFFRSLMMVVTREDYQLSLMTFPLFCVFVHYLTGFYVNIQQKTKLSLVFSCFFASIITSTLFFFSQKLKDALVSYEYFYLSLGVLITLHFFVTFLFRNWVFNDLARKYRTKKITKKTLIVGSGNNACKIADDVERYYPQNTIIGFIKASSKRKIQSDKILGNLFQIESIIEQYGIDEVIIAFEDYVDEKELFSIINRLYRYNVEIKFSPRLYDILVGSADIMQLGAAPLVSISTLDIPDWQLSTKRLIDILLSSVALLILSPLMLYFAIWIKRDSNGPAFYRQERIGRFGKPFNIIKFRSMYVDSETGTPKLSSANDDRITPVGRILRKYRIDEIPQFWNIIKGEMSLVGPRPERRFYINRIIEEAPYYCLLYKIRPGLTSWGPIKVGYTDNLEKMIERLNYDIIYIENMSLLNDLKILIYTIEILVTGKGI